MSTHGSQEILAFTLGSQEYGISILHVQEIRGYDTVTHLAGAPECIKGVINLRGTVVPIIDLRIMLNTGVVSYGEFTAVVILCIEDRMIGVVVDTVSDVTTLSAEQIKSTLAMSAAVKADYLLGLGVMEERTIVLIDIARLIASEMDAATEFIA